MKENIDVTKELQQKNQELLLNKKKIDLDTAMDSLIVFYDNYSNNIASDINSQICVYHGINPLSEQAKIFDNTINSFFFIISSKLKDVIANNIEPLKSKLKTISDDEYRKELNNISTAIVNQMLDYYAENVNMLCNELNQDVDENTKSKINNYLFEVMTIKMINTLKDKFMYSIKVIGNNYEENYQVMENINEKVLK